MIENSCDDIERMFFLTRTDGVTLSTFDEVFNCGNQALYDPKRPDLEFAGFGRNYLDRQFVALCEVLYYMLLEQKDSFVALSCKKVGGQYIVRLELSNETLEMELSEMVAMMSLRCKNQVNQCNCAG